MKIFKKELSQMTIGFGVVTVIFIIAGIYSLVSFYSLSNRIDSISSEISILNERLASTTNTLSSSIDDTRTSLANDISSQRKKVGAIQEQLGDFGDEVGDLSGTLNTLQKLAKTDQELLKKYSKVYFLNENYVPARLSEIPPTYQYSENRQLLIHTDVLKHLESMIKAASSSKVTLYVFSAYRSFAEQRALKRDYSLVYGAGTANTFSADQGYSEHQLGTTVDMITPGLGGVLDGFDKTLAYDWMLKNAYKYGFVLSYPKTNTYFVFEPWHWRFVGVDLATYLHKQNKSFYDLDQRTIDEYLVSIFD